MPKKKTVKRAPKTSKTKHHHLRHFHVLRLSCFGMLALGLMTIQVISHIQTTSAGRGQVLAYATNVSIGDLLAATNSSRAANGLGPLTLDSKLNSSAQAKANDMIAQNYWAHNAPDGTQPWSFFIAAGYNYAKAGENLAYGFDTSAQIEDAWMNSTGHRVNVLGDYADVGFGIANGSGYQGSENTVVVAHYGKKQAPPPPPSAPTSPTQAATPAPQPVAVVPEPAPAPEPTPEPEPVAEAPKEEVAKPVAAQQDLEPSKKVTNFETLLGGQANWAIYASIGVVGLSSIGFAGTHWQLVRRGWRDSRHFILVHPALDTAVIAAALAVILTSAAGFIK
jgi:uncharacterized protein YkwD